MGKAEFTAKVGKMTLVFDVNEDEKAPLLRVTVRDGEKEVVAQTDEESEVLTLEKEIRRARRFIFTH